MEKLIEGMDYTLNSGVLTINEGVKHIPDFQFVEDEDIENVVCPSTLISIGFKAFYRCKNLREVYISDSVKYIHTYSFSNCNLSTLTLGKNVYYIGYEAFSSNNLFEVINNSTKLRMISPFAFGFNENLMKFNMKSDAYVFSNTFFKAANMLELNCNSRFINFSETVVCGYQDKDKYTYENGVLKIKDGVEVIGDFRQLEDCVRVEMPDSVILIDSNAFNGLKKLENVKFSKNLFYIFFSSFASCSLRKNTIVLPESLCELKEYAFSYNEGENDIIVSNNTCIWRLTYSSKDAPYEFREYDEFVDKPEYKLNINDLIKEERELLESLSLMPDNINLNSTLNNNLDNAQTSILKESLIKFITYKNYKEENIDYVMKLLELKEINVRDLHEAINILFSRKQIKTIYLLISYGYDYFNNSMISRAIINNMNEMIDVLLLLGADINEIGTVETTPLSTACIVGNINIVKYLIEKGAAINMVDKNNKTAVDYAKDNNHLDIVDLLNNYNNDVSDIDKDLNEITKQLRIGG